MKILPFPERAQPQPQSQDEGPRDRRHYDTLDTALSDAETVLELLRDQLDTALIVDPADVAFLARRALMIVRGCQRAVHDRGTPSAGGEG